MIIPTYQRRELVRRAAASALAQTYRDFELIVVDDGSTDGTREAVQAVPRADGRLRYHWQPNRGVAAARNAGLRLARGTIVAFLDSDDRWKPKHLDLVTEVLIREPRAVLVSTCPGFVVRGSQRATDAGLVDYRHARLSRASEAGFIACIAVRREALLAVGGFDERLKVAEDSDVWRQLATLGSFAHVRRRTVVIQATSGSLRDRARRAGDYLAAADLSAQNLAAAVAGMGEPEQGRYAEEAAGMVHTANAMRALDRGDRATLRAELEAACRHLPLSNAPYMVEYRLRGHFPRFHEPDERLSALDALAEQWPQRHSLTARYLRARAIGLALRRGRLPHAGRLLAGWRIPGTVRFARDLTPYLRYCVRRSLQERRHRAHETPPLRGEGR